MQQGRGLVPPFPLPPSNVKLSLAVGGQRLRALCCVPSLSLLLTLRARQLPKWGLSLRQGHNLRNSAGLQAF